MVYRLGILHQQIIQEVEQIDNPIEALQTVLVLTLQYFRVHQGLIKLFFMQIGYGDTVATQQLFKTRQNYRNILENILQKGIIEGAFLPLEVLDMEIAINSIIGTINWTLYDLLVVRNENIELEKLATKLSAHIMRSLLQ